MVSRKANLMTIPVQIEGPTLEQLPKSILSKLKGFDLQLNPDNNLYPREFSFRTKSGVGLTDNERLSLVLLTLFREQAGEVFLLWELRLWLIEQSTQQGDALSCLILRCSNYRIAIYQLSGLSSHWEIFLQRNFAQNVHSGLKKLKLVFPQSGPITIPIRKRGYTDKGSLAPPDKRARLDARAYWQELLDEQRILLSKQQFLDTVELLTGFTT